ncbi:hypothetical protein [Streptomyces sp. NPDC055036]
MTAVLTKADTFAALDDCFTADLAALTGGEPPRNPIPNQFIDLVEEVRDVLATSSIGNRQDASEDLHSAAGHLTDVLTSPGGEQRSLLARARTHLRDAIKTAS